MYPKERFVEETENSNGVNFESTPVKHCRERKRERERAVYGTFFNAWNSSSELINALLDKLLRMLFWEATSKNNFCVIYVPRTKHYSPSQVTFPLRNFNSKLFVVSGASPSKQGGNSCSPQKLHPCYLHINASTLHTCCYGADEWERGSTVFSSVFAVHWELWTCSNCPLSWLNALL